METTVKKNHVRPVARAGPVLRALAGAALVLLAFAVLIGCSEPTKPKDVKYNVYIAAADGYYDTAPHGYIYIVDAESLSIIDSIPFEHNVMNIVVSPDGHYLYTQSYGTHVGLQRVSKIDISTKRVLWQDTRIVLGSMLSLLKNGELLLRSQSETVIECVAEVLDPNDGSLVAMLADSLCRNRGPQSGTDIAAIFTDPQFPASLSSTISVTDVVTGAVHGQYLARLHSDQRLFVIRDPLLHPDGRRVLALGIRSLGDAWFVVGDVLSGETLLEQSISRSSGEIAISDDGTLAVVSSPVIGVINPEADNVSRLDIFDLNDYRHLKRFELLTSQIRFLPGTRRIITAPGVSWQNGGHVRLIDLDTYEEVRGATIPPYPGAVIGGFAVGPRP